MDNLKKYIVCANQNIRDAIKKMDKGGIGFVVVCSDDKQKVIGVISNGDFRRAVLNGVSLDDNVLQITNRNFRYLEKNYSKEDVFNLFQKAAIQHIPIIENGKLKAIITEENFFGIKGVKKRAPLINNPVIIMSGGRGARLDPLTRVLPKPLIPIGDKAMIEVIMDEYAKYGMKEFYISVNYKEKMIKAYFEERDIHYKINYVNESRPLGTAGALKYLERKIHSTFFVSNCEIIIKENYVKIYQYHKNRKFDLTLVASIKYHMIPYGVCLIKNGGVLKEIKEKPEYDFLINAGMYVIEPIVFQLMSKDEKIDMTDLIGRAQKKGLIVGVYPVSETSYLDIGQFVEYKKMVKLLFEN